MACQDNEIDSPPEDDRKHGGDENVSSEACYRTDSFGNPFRKEGNGDMLPPLQGYASGQQRRPYEAIPGKFLRPEERKEKDISKYDLDEDIKGHHGDNDKYRGLGASIDYFACSFH